MSEQQPSHREVPHSVRATLSTDHEIALTTGWELARCAPRAITSPASWASASPLEFQPAPVPGTAAQVLGAGPELADRDHWYRCRFRVAPNRARRTLLCFDGLATFAEVWLNGLPLLRSDNMFVAHALDVSTVLAPENEIAIVFRALGPILRERRPRGRWPVPLVTEKNLRFVRTTLLGHMPGFCPPTLPVGPWRGVRLVQQGDFGLWHVRLLPHWNGTAGELEVALHLVATQSARIESAEVLVAGTRFSLDCSAETAGIVVVSGRGAIPNVEPWWPHTHGAPRLYPASARLRTADGRTITVDLGGVGFRSVALEDGDFERFDLRINGERIFCRGAAWPPRDALALHDDAQTLRAALDLAVAGGMNMLRVTGNFVYESDEFHRLCDELGILVFSDFMFANMDYPCDDARWLSSVEVEATQLLERVAGRPSLTILCGNTEVAQQAAMMGLPAEAWSNALFDRVLPGLCERHSPGVPYAPSSPFGGAMPFHVGKGLSHYYGVGGYRRGMHDPRLARPRFVSECLAFANPPSDATLRAWLGVAGNYGQDPRYEQRIPRDLGASWTFADVTDHYVRELYGEDPADLRRNDDGRRLELSRAAASETMAVVQHQLRPRSSGCAGALIWMFRDMHDAPGLGIVDARGLPKAPYYALKRAWASVALWCIDSGMDGVTLVVANDRPVPLAAELRVALYRANGTIVEAATVPIELPAHGESERCVEQVLGHFVDSSYAFRFGAPSHTLVAAWLMQGTTVLARTFHLPLGLRCTRRDDLELHGELRPLANGDLELKVSSNLFAQCVRIDAPGFRANDDGFHLAPKEAHDVTLTKLATRGPVTAVRLSALNASRHFEVVLVPESSDA